MTNDTVNKKAKSPKSHKNVKDMTKWEYTMLEVKRTWVGYLLVLPFLVCFLIFTVLPVILSLFLSLTSFNMLQMPRWVGLNNYITLLLDDDLFITAFSNTLLFAVATGPTSYILSFLVAWFINELPPKIRSIVTLVFYSPSIAGNAYTIWALIFQGDIYGYANGWLMKLGIIDNPIVFLKDTRFIVPICIMVSLWTSLGTGFLANIAGLQGVDRSLYEAGAMDGIKNRWQEAWYVTIPSMKEIMMFSALLAITGSFSYGGVITALCGNPSTDYCAWTLTHHYSEYIGTRFEYGYASAISVVLFLLMVGSNSLVQKFIKKVGE